MDGPEGDGNRLADCGRRLGEGVIAAFGRSAPPLPALRATFSLREKVICGGLRPR